MTTNENKGRAHGRIDTLLSQDGFKCVWCDYSTNSKDKMRTHDTEKHSTIEQLDGGGRDEDIATIANVVRVRIECKFDWEECDYATTNLSLMFTHEDEHAAQ